MGDKPSRASEYRSEQVDLVRSACLYVATKLGDLMDEVVVVGGLVPSLLIDQEALSEGTSAHVGTADLDVGLNLHFSRGDGTGRLPNGCGLPVSCRTAPTRGGRRGSAGE